MQTQNKLQHEKHQKRVCRVSEMIYQNLAEQGEINEHNKILCQWINRDACADSRVQNYQVAEMKQFYDYFHTDFSKARSIRMLYSVVRHASSCSKLTRIKKMKLLFHKSKLVQSF